MISNRVLSSESYLLCVFHRKGYWSRLFANYRSNKYIKLDRVLIYLFYYPLVSRGRSEGKRMESRAHDTRFERSIRYVSAVTSLLRCIDLQFRKESPAARSLARAWNKRPPCATTRSRTMCRFSLFLPPLFLSLFLSVFHIFSPTSSSQLRFPRILLSHSKTHWTKCTWLAK